MRPGVSRWAWAGALDTAREQMHWSTPETDLVQNCAPAQQAGSAQCTQHDTTGQDTPLHAAREKPNVPLPERFLGGLLPTGCGVD